MSVEISERLQEPEPPQVTLTLPFELRQKSRLLTRLDNGEEVRLFLNRGTVLRPGDLLRTNTGLVVRVEAALEEVSTARARNRVQLARACYQLGNRHVLLQIGPGWLRYLRDPVLDVMVGNLGLRVVAERLPFEPESGTYHHEHSSAASSSG